MASLISLLAPVLFIVIFYLLLAMTLWLIFRPPTPLAVRWPRSWRLPQPGPSFTRPWPADPVSRRIYTATLPLLAAGLAGLILPLPARLALLLIQFGGAAIVVLLVDWSVRIRQADLDTRCQLAALTSAEPAIALDALRRAAQAGRLRSGTLRHLDLRGVHWAGADLRFVDLAGSNLSLADLRHADLTGACLLDCCLDRALLIDACLPHADLRNASLQAARLKGADLHGARLSAANLTQARLSLTVLDHADLVAATLCGAQLKGASLTGARLTDARYDAATHWPKGYDPDRAGARCQPTATQPGADAADGADER